MKKPWVDHVALRVADIDWHLSFWQSALGMELIEEHPKTDASPRQVWLGGLQLTDDRAFRPDPAQRAWHIGVDVADLAAAANAVAAYPLVQSFGDETQPYWFSLPDGLVLELVCRSL